MLQVSRLYLTTGKTIALTLWHFDDKVMFLLFNTMSRFAIAFLPREALSFIIWIPQPAKCSLRDHFLTTCSFCLLLPLTGSHIRVFCSFRTSFPVLYVFLTNLQLLSIPTTPHLNCLHLPFSSPHPVSSALLTPLACFHLYCLPKNFLMKVINQHKESPLTKSSPFPIQPHELLESCSSTVVMSMGG